MKIVIAGRNDRDAWDDYVSAHPDSCAYQLYAWKELVESVYGFGGLYLLAREQGAVVGIFPLVDFRRPFLPRKLISLPYCDVGGVLADRSDVADQLLMEARRWCSTLQIGGFEIRSMEKQPCEVQTSDKVRMVLPLPSSADELLEAMKAKLRSQIKKPLKDGLRCLLGGMDLLEDFYNVWSFNMRELGSPVHSFDWFRQIVENYRERSRVAVVYTPDDTPAAAGIILTCSRTVSIPWASSLRTFNRLNPNMLLYWTLLAYAADRGYRFFDFGRSTVGEGTYRFKEQWGARPHPLNWLRVEPDGRFRKLPAVKGGLRSHVETFWKHLPLGCCNTLGPVIRKNVSL